MPDGYDKEIIYNSAIIAFDAIRANVLAMIKPKISWDGEDGRRWVVTDPGLVESLETAMNRLFPKIIATLKDMGVSEEATPNVYLWCPKREHRLFIAMCDECPKPCQDRKEVKP